jgi:hypothetical protein
MNEKLSPETLLGGGDPQAVDLPCPAGYAEMSREDLLRALAKTIEFSEGTLDAVSAICAVIVGCGLVPAERLIEGVNLHVELATRNGKVFRAAPGELLVEQVEVIARATQEQLAENAKATQDRLARTVYETPALTH